MSLVPRTVTEAEKDRPQPLAAFRQAAAFVLLGDPGAGKTSEFRREVEALGAGALFLPVRDFLTFAERRADEWSGRTLFIDGLDEVRAGSGDPRTPLDQIRKQLDALGKPRFRLSCRAADWLVSDRQHLREVSPDKSVTLLRLDPLRDPDIWRLLETSLGGAGAEHFLKTARETSLSGWLRNPQGIEILIRAFAAGRGWPASRREALEAACLCMAGEHNPEHRDAARDQRNPSGLLDAAGELCATLLLSGAAGCSRDASPPDDPDDDYPPADCIQPADQELARAALNTKLFTEAVAAGVRRFVPCHRQIAEFLGARHLARKIESGLPLGRVLAVMTAPDGAPPTPLRGLAAWLAAHCRSARAPLIERDALGMAVYGDLHELTPDQKVQLLQRIHAQDPKPYVGSLSADALRHLAVPELAPALRRFLESPGRTDADQVVTKFVLRALALGEPMPEFAELLLGIVRDETRWSVVHERALDAFFHNCGDGEPPLEGARRLLHDICRGAIRDADRQLLGTLLSRLYPAEIPPDEVWTYLREQPDELMGRYSRFWWSDLLELTPEERLPDLIEALGARLPGLRPVLHAQHLDQLPFDLLAQALERVGDRTPTSRLCDWFEIAAMSGPVRANGAASGRAIRTFLEQRPDLHQALWIEGLQRCPEADGLNLCAHRVAVSLWRARLPEHFGRFCLDRAVELADARPRLAAWLLRKAIEHAAEEGITRDELVERTRWRTKLHERLPDLLQTPVPEGHLDWKRDERDHTAEMRVRETEWEGDVRSEVEALRENRASPPVLHGIARSYLSTREQHFAGPRGNWFSDRALIEAALAGLRGVPYRQDLPEVTEILRLADESRMHTLALPFLAGLEVIEQEDPARLRMLNDTQRRIALAFYYTVPIGRRQHPPWYQELLRSCPDLVAGVLIRRCKSEIAAGSEVPGALESLANQDHREVAGRAALPLLRGFPLRGRGRQLRILDCLLWAGLRHADRTELGKIISRKVASKSVTAAQRAHWLTAGLVAVPDEYRPRFDALTRSRDEITREAARFLDGPWGSWFPERDTPPETLTVLVQRVGALFAPDDAWTERRGDLPATAAARTQRTIETLGGQPDSAARDALDLLLADPALADWRGTLELARDRQRTASRDAAYTHCSVERAAQLLRGGLPANAADLLALVAQHLDDFAAELRGGDENSWRGFWNEDSYGRATDPKPENSCRDAVLSVLRHRLHDRIEVLPEARHANDTRADLRVSCNGIAVPIEIRREGHPDLFTAVSDQLPKYTSLPAAAGHGIYLVLWFGGTRTPEGLRQVVEAGLPRNDGSKIEVRVLDCSRPVRGARSKQIHPSQGSWNFGLPSHA